MFGRKKEKDQDGKIGKYALKHIQGLDIPETVCTVELSTDKVIITGGGKEYNLNLERILSVNFEMDVDVQKYSKSSMTAGIVGVAAFGVAGAVIGAAPREKTKRLVTGCAILGYLTSDGSQAYLLLQGSQPNDMQAAKFVDKIRPLVQQRPTQSIEL